MTGPNAPSQRLYVVVAVDLASGEVGHDENERVSGLDCIARRCKGWIGEDNQRQTPTFLRETKSFQPHKRTSFLQFRKELEDISVTTCLFEMADFGMGLQVDCVLCQSVVHR